MIKKISSLILALSSTAYCDVDYFVAEQQPQMTTRSPQQISEDLNSIQHEFEVAQEIFIPWYTGPLITGSANNCPPGRVNLQPYAFFDLTYSAYDGHRNVVNIPNIYTINPVLVLQTGITKWLDVTTVPQGFFRWQQDRYGQGFGDLPLQFVFKIYQETPYIPSIRFILGEIFPTGSYKNLNPSRAGLDSTGGGVYSTTFGLNFSKVFWQVPLHPIATRLSTQYVQPNCKAYVTGLNSYGGGNDTDGNVAVGAGFSADLGIEVSITQKIVFATDLVYSCNTKSTFSGNPGFDDTGLPFFVGVPSSDQLSLAPAIEYNVSSTGGFIGGVWFTLTGRNSSDFVSLVLSYTQLF